MANEKLKAKIAAELATRGWQWKELASKTGLGVNTFPGWWRGRAPDTSSLEKVAIALGIPLAALMESDPQTARVERRQMNLEAEPFIEIKGKVWATPDRISIQRAQGQYIKGKPGEQDCFALQVEGDSMMPWYIPGELIICRPKPFVLSSYSETDEEAPYVPYDKVAHLHNRDAVVEHEGDTMLKRIVIERTRGPMYKLWMTSTNPKYPKIAVRMGDEWRMQAIVIRSDKPQIPE